MISVSYNYIVKWAGGGVEHFNRNLHEPFVYIIQKSTLSAWGDYSFTDPKRGNFSQF